MVMGHKVATAQHNRRLGEGTHRLVHAGDGQVSAEADRGLWQLARKGEQRAPRLIDDKRFTVSVTRGRDRGDVAGHTEIGWTDDEDGLGLGVGLELTLDLLDGHTMLDVPLRVLLWLQGHQLQARVDRRGDRRFVGVTRDEHRVARAGAGEDRGLS